MATITVPYQQLGEDYGFEEGIDERGPYAIVPYWVDWANRYTFANQLVGQSYAAGSNASGIWIKFPGFQYPPSPNIYAVSCRIKPAGNITAQPATNGQPIIYDFAIVTAQYRKPSWDAQVADDPSFFASLSSDPTENQNLLFATQEIDFGSEWITVPESAYQFVTAPTKSTIPISIRYGVARMVLTWNRYPLMPMSKVQTYVDSLNDATFLNCSRGTVMFEGVKTVREAAVDGTITQKVQMNLKWRQHDWNMVIRPDSLTWDSIIDGSSQKPYAYKDFSQLLLG